MKSKQHANIVNMVSDRSGLSMDEVAILQEQMVGKMLKMQEGLYLYGSNNLDLLADFIIKKVPGDISASSSPIHYLYKNPNTDRIISVSIEMNEMEFIMKLDENQAPVTLLPERLQGKLLDEDGNNIETVEEFRRSFLGGSGTATQNRLIPADIYTYTGSSWIENWNYIEKYSEVSEVDLSAITRQTDIPESLGNYQFKQSWTEIRTLTFEVVDENGNKRLAKLPYRVQKVDAQTYSGVVNEKEIIAVAKDEVKYLNNGMISTSDELVSPDGMIDNRFIALNHVDSQHRPIDMMQHLLEPAGNKGFRGYDAYTFPMFIEVLPSTSPKTWEYINYKMVFDDPVTPTQAKDTMERIITGTYDENMDHFGLTGIEYDFDEQYIDLIYQTRGSSVKPSYYQSSIYSTSETRASDFIDPSDMRLNYPSYPALGGSSSDYLYVGDRGMTSLPTNDIHNVVVNNLKNSDLRQKYSHAYLLEYFTDLHIPSLDRTLTFEEAEYFADLLSGSNGFGLAAFANRIDGFTAEDAMSGDGIEAFLRQKYDLSRNPQNVLVYKRNHSTRGYQKGELNKDIQVLKDFFDDDILEMYKSLPLSRDNSLQEEVHGEVLDTLIGKFREILTDVLDDQNVVLNNQVGLDGKLLPRSGIVREHVPIDGNDLGEMFDEYFGSLNQVQILLSDPNTADEMMSNIIGSVIHNEYETKISRLRNIIIKNSEKVYVNVQSPSGNSTSQVAYKYHISHTYLDQLVQFDILLTNDLTSVYVMDGIDYIATPLIKNGGWNSDLFVEIDFAGVLQDELDNGMFPRANFNGKDDPMNFLKLVLNMQYADETGSRLNLIDDVVGVFDLIASDMRPDVFSVFMVKYEDLLKKEMVINIDVEIYDSRTKTNSTWVEFFDDLMLSLNKDMFRSNNPTANHRASKTFANEIYRDQVLNSDMPDNQIYNEIIGSIGLLDNEFSEMIFTDPENVYPAYNDFYSDGVNSEGLAGPTVNIWQFVDPFGITSFDHLAKSDYSDPIDRLGHEKQSLHNLVGIGHAAFVYPTLALDNALRYRQLYRDYYDNLDLISPNKGAVDAFTNSFSLSFSLDFFKFGVRNNYGTMPIITQFYFSILTNPNLYYNQGSGNFLLEYAYDSTLYSY
ncbi:MAG: hypothetical protein GPJ54_16200 [Candidatus Heimdallarchaeota archaeon]|nr:hypothetical protein [Candidatus Heimdallarchaeota archaeon]